MYCRHCGSQISDNANFCRQCGIAVSRASDPDSAPAASAPAVQPALAESDTAPVPREMPVCKTTAVPVLDNATPPQPTDQPVKPKKKRWIGVTALLLAIALLAGGFLIHWLTPESNDDDDEKESSSQHEDDKDNGDEDEDSPVNVELTINEATLVYELTDDDVAAFYELLASTEALAIEGKDEDALTEALEALDDSFNYLQAQQSIATVLHYCDLEDTDASDLYLSSTKMLTEANDEYIKMCRRVYESDSPAKDIFFTEWTEQEMDFLMYYTDEVMTLLQRNSEIEVEYQKLQNESDMYEAMVPLYIEMVQNNNRIARIYGYDNYYEYAYEVEYLRDYDPEQITVMRTYVIDYILDALDYVTERFFTNLEGLTTRKYTKLTGLLLNSYEDGNEDYIIGYLKTLPEQARNDMLDMLNGDIIMKDDTVNAMEGAFTATLGEDRQVCFFGPGYNNTMTLIHEVGHYYGGCHQYLDDLPLDLAETHSQGNEWLFLKYLEGELSEDVYQVMVDYRFVNDLSMIIVCVIIDEFEQRVYTHPNIDSLTGDDLDEIMADVCMDYGGIDYLTTNITDIQEYWRMVVVEQPVYYISYAVSSIASMDLYTVAIEDYDAAVAIYQALIENADLEDGFLGNITNAGLSSPFDEEFYIEIRELIKDEG